MRYTALEIDRLRDAVTALYWRRHPWPQHSMTLADSGRHAVERQLCTYMANETTADELEALVRVGG